uniref:Carbohydrate esterase family 16 protein n=1 Tax=Thermothelomyces thermophilus TaxID=78579 RepID=UPI0027963C69|nr:Chain A, Carbohydrate esterase family 16 protein [Thermothelomyces thermophilus]7ZTN_B Chain B, Carbohydrate esterase family 16 protein [Thermothelomyces thermophilus]
SIKSHKDHNFETLVTFGDSYTDNGRLGYYINHGGKAPRPGTMHDETTTTASGGLSWAQFAARDAGATLMDYAVSGAVCSNQIVSRYFDLINRTFPAILDDEIPSFQADVLFKSLYPHRTAENTVYAVWIGTNDLGWGAFLSDSQTPGKTISDFVSCVFSVLDHVYKTGGRRFVILNTVPLELAPLYALPENGGTLDSQYWNTKTKYNMTEYGQKIREYSTSVNTMLENGALVMASLKKRWPKAMVDVFDVHSLFNDIYNAPTKYLDAPHNVNSYYHQCGPAGSPCTDQPGSLNGYMWYDELHPSNKTSSIVARNFLDVVAGKSKYGTRFHRLEQKLISEEDLNSAVDHHHHHH